MVRSLSAQTRSLRRPNEEEAIDSLLDLAIQRPVVSKQAAEVDEAPDNLQL